MKYTLELEKLISCIMQADEQNWDINSSGTESEQLYRWLYSQEHPSGVNYLFFHMLLPILNGVELDSGIFNYKCFTLDDICNLSAVSDLCNPSSINQNKIQKIYHVVKCSNAIQQSVSYI